MICGGVLSGGESRRMGRPKASLLIAGSPMIAFTERALAPLCDRVYHLGPNGLPDLAPHSGPLAGILAARHHHPEAWWVIAACDMPLITQAAVEWLLTHRCDGAQVVMPRNDAGVVQPTFALYGPGSEVLLSTLKAPKEAQDHPGVLHPEIPESLAMAWTNINTPEALSALSAGR